MSRENIFFYFFLAFYRLLTLKKSDPKFSNGKYKKIIRNSDVEILCKIRKFRIKVKLTFLIKKCEANTKERPKNHNQCTISPQEKNQQLIKKP